MFTYKIRRHNEQRNKLTDLSNFHSREATLKRNIEKTWFKVGDRVRFKKQKKGAIYATIVEIIEDPDKVSWSHGGLCPMNIVIDVEKKDRANGVAYGTERMKTNVKKLVYVSASGK